jgi:hypothetical protein
MVDLDFDERFPRILDHEIAMRVNARVARRTRDTGFAMRAAPEDFELTEGRGTHPRNLSLPHVAPLAHQPP